MRQRTDGHRGRSGSDLRQAGQTVLAIDVHGARTANTLTARSSEGEGVIELVLDLEQGVEDHRAAATRSIQEIADYLFTSTAYLTI